MFKYAVFNDLHLADNPPIGRVQGYQDQLFAKLEACATILNDENVDCAVFTGDVFHVKRPSFVSHALVNRVMDFMSSGIDCQVLICPGNHDLTETGILSLPRQPLGSLFQADVAMPLIKDESWYSVRSGKNRILFVGRHFDTDGDTNPEYYQMTESEFDVVQDVKPNLVVMVAHGSIVPPDENPIYPHLNINRIDWEAGSLTPTILHCGHLHEDYGIHRGKPIYTNLGSFGRPSRNQFVDNRDFLMVTLDDDGTLSLERRTIPLMLPAAEVFFEKAEEFEDEAMAEYAELLATSISIEDGSLEDAMALLDKVPENVKNRVRQYLEEAGI